MEPGKAKICTKAVTVPEIGGAVKVGAAVIQRGVRKNKIAVVNLVVQVCIFCICAGVSHKVIQADTSLDFIVSIAVCFSRVVDTVFKPAHFINLNGVVMQVSGPETLVQKIIK